MQKNVVTKGSRVTFGISHHRINHQLCPKLVFWFRSLIGTSQYQLLCEIASKRISVHLEYQSEDRSDYCVPLLKNKCGVVYIFWQLFYGQRSPIWWLELCLHVCPRLPLFVRCIVEAAFLVAFTMDDHLHSVQFRVLPSTAHFPM